MFGSIRYFFLHARAGQVDEVGLATLQEFLEEGYGFSRCPPVTITDAGTTKKICFFLELERGRDKQIVLTRLVAVASGGSQDVDGLMAVQGELAEGYEAAASFVIEVAGTTTQVLYIIFR